MFYDIVAVARDWSILILALPALVLLGVQVFILWHVTRALRSFSPRVRPALRTASSAVARAADAVEQTRAQVERPVLQARAVPAQIRGFARALRSPRYRR